MNKQKFIVFKLDVLKREEFDSAVPPRSQPLGQGPIRIDVEAARTNPLGVPRQAAAPKGLSGKNTIVVTPASALHAAELRLEAIPPGHLLARPQPTKDEEFPDLPADSIDPVGNDNEDVGDPITEDYTYLDVFKRRVVDLERRSQQNPQAVLTELIKLLAAEMAALERASDTERRNHVERCFQKTLVVIDHMTKKHAIMAPLEILQLVDWLAWARQRTESNPHVKLGPYPELLPSRP